MITDLVFQETAGLARLCEPVTFGIPFSPGAVATLEDRVFVDDQGKAILFESRVVSRWPDTSIRWAHIDVQASLNARCRSSWHLQQANTVPAERPAAPVLVRHNDRVEIRNGPNRFIIFLNRVDFPILHIYNGHAKAPLAACLSLSKTPEQVWQGRVGSWRVEHSTGLRLTLCLNGGFHRGGSTSAMGFTCRLHFFAEKSWVKADLSVVNPKPASHPQGAWDLGDANGILFRNLGLKLANADSLAPFIRIDPGSDFHHGKVGDRVKIFQASSGGKNWNSLAHVNRHGTVALGFKGYQVTLNNRAFASGDRACPVVGGVGHDCQVTCYHECFWQNFPKRMAAGGNGLSLDFFPDINKDLHELQPGEQKTHTFYLAVDKPDAPVPGFDWAASPLFPEICTDVYARGIFPYPVSRQGCGSSFQSYFSMVDSAVRGPDNFFEKCEAMDEFGWRNFGDIPADHEAVFAEDPARFVSHYNNQYDVVKGAVLQFMGSGQRAWFNLAHRLACHVVDIDIYHTRGDKSEFNNGMFWHTDHHLDAFTSTHRTISLSHKSLKPKGAFGGGPAPDHNYATGLLYLFWMTGDHRFKEAVLLLASNIVNCLYAPDTLLGTCVRGARQAVGMIKRPPEGAGLNYENIFRFNGPGRVSGNGLNTLVDAWLLTEDPIFLDNARILITRAVSPTDDIPAQDLLNAEIRWMYTIFLQALGRYLGVLAETGLQDTGYAYARAVLLHYARWMADHERGYLDSPEGLDFPDETWAAQEIRKADVFAYAAAYAAPSEKAVFTSKCRKFFDRCMNTLASFQSRRFTRPVAILMTCGHPAMNLLTGQFKAPSYRDTAVRKNHWQEQKKFFQFSRSVQRRYLLNWMKRFSLNNELRQIKNLLKSRWGR